MAQQWKNMYLVIFIPLTSIPALLLGKEDFANNDLQQTWDKFATFLIDFQIVKKSEKS